MQCPLCMQEGLEHRVDPTAGGIVKDRGNYMMVCSACSEVQILSSEALDNARRDPARRAKYQMILGIIFTVFTLIEVLLWTQVRIVRDYDFIPAAAAFATIRVVGSGVWVILRKQPTRRARRNLVLSTFCVAAFFTSIFMMVLIYFERYAWK